MIGRLKGIIAYLEPDHVIVDVNGVGYIVLCSGKTLSAMHLGSTIELFIETHVREDQITLYGFSTRQDKACFLKLITVKGIGPKLALQILSSLTIDQIFLGITTKDESMFSKIPGVGSKLVSRMLTELKDKDFMSFNITTVDSPLKEEKPQLLRNDAVSALVNLGVNKSEAYTIVSKIIAAQQDITIDRLITLALHEMAGQR